MLRDMMLYHARKFDDAKERIAQARALIQWLGDFVRTEDNPYGMLLKSELEQMERWQDNYFRHDSLEEINEPLYFHQFMERAEGHGLQYLAEAEFPSMLTSNFEAPMAEALERLGRDIIEMEQYTDFVRNRMFRQTLLCHRKVKLNRALGPWTAIDFRIAASLRPLDSESDPHLNGAQIFAGINDSRISIAEAVVKNALVVLGESWPATIPCRDLLRKVGTVPARQETAEELEPSDPDADRTVLGSALLALYAKGLCEFQVQPEQFVTTPGERPRVCELARLQASRGKDLTNRRHERLHLDHFDRQVVSLLDGQHDRTELVEELTNLAKDRVLNITANERNIIDPQEVREIMRDALEDALRRLARLAILIG